uniref:Major histocompatibility complex class I-related gene protein-like n=1 Tax=Fundulus heteroclitus TaxID=8078 RepID=A0A3Q2QHW4_FUNHE
ARHSDVLFSVDMQHSLRYFLTATNGVPGFPEFIGAATVDEVQVGYCDSNIKTAKPRQDWIRRLIEEDPKHLEWYSDKCLEEQHVFRANIDNFKQRLNLTQGPSILQRMNGCEWDDETGDIKGFNQYGFNGEDFLAVDLNTLTWTAPKSQAVVIKLLWDEDKANLEFNKNYCTNQCPNWLKNYVHHGRSFLQRTESPSVSLLQKTPASVVTCHATGFYPDRAEIFWRKDGEEIHEGVEKGEILMNNDGTFQMSAELNISSIQPGGWRRYDCVFQLSGAEDDVIVTLDKSVIRTNWASSPEIPVAGGVAAFLLLGVAVIVAVFWLRKRNGEETMYFLHDRI